MSGDRSGAFTLRTIHLDLHLDLIAVVSLATRIHHLDLCALLRSTIESWQTAPVTAVSQRRDDATMNAQCAELARSSSSRENVSTPHLRLGVVQSLACHDAQNTARSSVRTRYGSYSIFLACKRQLSASTQKYYVARSSRPLQQVWSGQHATNGGGTTRCASLLMFSCSVTRAAGCSGRGRLRAMVTQRKQARQRNRTTQRRAMMAVAMAMARTMETTMRAVTRRRRARRTAHHMTRPSLSVAAMRCATPWAPASGSSSPRLYPTTTSLYRAERLSASGRRRCGRLPRRERITPKVRSASVARTSSGNPFAASDVREGEIGADRRCAMYINNEDGM